MTVDPRPCPVCDGDGLRLRSRFLFFDEIASTFGLCVGMVISQQGAQLLHMLRCDPCDGNGWVSP